MSASANGPGVCCRRAEVRRVVGAASEGQTAKTKKKKAAAPANAGAAIVADPRLRAAVSAVCSVRRRKVGGEVVAAGAVTNMVRQNRIADGTDSTATREKKREQKFEETRKKKLKKAQKEDAANEVDLVKTEARLDELLRGKSGKGTKLDFLSKQFNGRIDLEITRTQ